MARLSVQPIHAQDECRIEANFYEPFERAPPKRVAIINSGAGIPKSFYEPFASWLADQGIAAVTYDYRGIGGSRGRSLRGLSASIQDWGSKDCAAVLRAVESKYPGVKICIVGHSIGGIVTGFVTKPPEIDRMVLVSPHTGYWRDYARSARPKMFLFWHVLMPAVTRIFGYFPGRLFGLPEDLPYGIAMEWAFRRDRGFFGGLVEAFMDKSEKSGPRHFSRFISSILTIRPSDDPFATEAGRNRVASLFSKCSFCDLPIEVKAAEHVRVGHFGFFGRANRERLWPTALDWLKFGNNS